MFLKDLINLKLTQEAEEDAAQGPEDQNYNQNLEEPNPTPTKTTPEPEDKPEPKTLVSAGDFKVVLVGDDQVNIVDSKGNSRLRMPLVIWQQLSRGSA